MKKDGDKSDPPPPLPEPVRGKYYGRHRVVVIHHTPSPPEPAPKSDAKTKRRK